MGGESCGVFEEDGEKEEMSKRVSLQNIFIAGVDCMLATIVTGCGYTTRSLLSAQYKTIYITPFVNKINMTNEAFTENKYQVYRPYLETELTKAVTNKYLFDGNLKPVAKANADLVLKGELVGFSRDPLRYTDSDEVDEYRMTVSVNLSLWNTRENKLLWEEKGFGGSTEYFTSFSSSNPKKSDDVALTDAVTDIARRIVDRTVEQW